MSEDYPAQGPDRSPDSFDDPTQSIDGAPESDTLAARLEAQFGVWSMALKVTEQALDEHQKAIEEARAVLQAAHQVRKEEVRSSDELRRTHQSLTRELEHMHKDLERWSEQAQALERSLGVKPAAAKQGAAWPLPQTLLVLGLLLLIVLNVVFMIQLAQQNERLDKIFARWELDYLRPLAEGRSRPPTARPKS